jgi:hypothetical protein
MLISFSDLITYISFFIQGTWMKKASFCFAHSPKSQKFTIYNQLVTR